MKQIRIFAGDCLDRVVEMASIQKALQNAIPGGIPWPKLNTLYFQVRALARAIAANRTLVSRKLTGRLCRPMYHPPLVNL